MTSEFVEQKDEQISLRVTEEESVGVERATEFRAVNPDAMSQKPCASETAGAAPAALEPAALERAALEPLASEPMALEPAASEPEVSEPMASEPMASEPEVSELMASEPAASSAGNAAPDFGGRFEVLDLIGEGGMGLVYKVFDPALQKVFAVKVLRSVLADDKHALKRFALEAEAAIRLDHPNLVSIYEQNVLADGTPFLVMDFVEGDNLAQVLESNERFDTARALKIFDQMIEALEHVHEAGLVHRDVKPRNIILTRNESGDETVKLVDFGIAKDVHQVGATTVGVTQTGDFLGSPLYMSPEQCQGGELEARSDIYSAGCVLYEMITGRTPFASNNPVKIVVGHLSEKPELPSSILGNKSAGAVGMDMVILKCLEKVPSRRYSCAAELRRDIAILALDKNPVQERTQQELRGIWLGVAIFAPIAGFVLGSGYLPFDAVGTFLSALRPLAPGGFVLGTIAFIILTGTMNNLRNQGFYPQERKEYVIPWTVSYITALMSYVLLPRIPETSPFVPMYLPVLGTIFAAAVVSWLWYQALPKASFFPVKLTGIPSAEEKNVLNGWAVTMLLSGASILLLGKAPIAEPVSSVIPIAFPLLGASISALCLIAVTRRLRGLSKVTPGDKWASLACISFCVAFLSNLFGVVVNWQSERFLIPLPMASDLSGVANVVMIATLVIGFAFTTVWMNRRKSISPFGKSDGW